MVARALNGVGVREAKVNRRHDIVLDAGVGGGQGFAKEGSGAEPLKISGSAYKLTRLRSLHHGTCLLSSPNLKHIHQYLRSPAKPFITARGVESVRSPVANTGVPTEAFQQATIKEFAKLYKILDPSLEDLGRYGGLRSGPGWVGGIVDDELGDVPEIKRGMEELMVSARFWVEGMDWLIDEDLV